MALRLGHTYPTRSKRTFQVDMLRALKVAEPIYLRTRDVELAKLLERAEVVLRHDDEEGKPVNPPAAVLQ